MKARARSAARHLALDALSLADSAKPGTDQDLARPRVHNLYLHEVPRQEEERFRSLLRWLVDTGHTLIPYGEGIDRCAHDRVDRSYVTFSFDDGYASNVRAAQILEEFHTTGCFFVVTDFIGHTDLSSARAFLGTGITEPAMSWSDLHQLRAAGHEIGNHTRSHKNLAAMPEDQASEEIDQGRLRLETEFGDVPHFAWPLGRWHHFTESARQTASSTHKSVASAERGSHGPSIRASGDWCPRRDHIMTSWPLRHSKIFVRRSARLSTAPDQWPSLAP